MGNLGRDDVYKRRPLPWSPGIQFQCLVGRYAFLSFENSQLKKVCFLNSLGEFLFIAGDKGREEWGGTGEPSKICKEGLCPGLRFAFSVNSLMIR